MEKEKGDAVPLGKITDRSLYRDRFAPSRKDEVEQIRRAIEEGKNVSIFGPRYSGKSSLAYYCAGESFEGRSSLYIDLEIMEDMDDFYMKLRDEMGELTEEEEQKGVKVDVLLNSVTKRPLVVFVDEFEMLIIEDSARDDFVDFVRETTENGSIIWVAVSRSALPRIDERLGTLFPEVIEVDEIPAELRPTSRMS